MRTLTREYLSYRHAVAPPTSDGAFFLEKKPRELTLLSDYLLTFALEKNKADIGRHIN